LRQELRKQISRKRTSRKRQWFRLAQTWRCWSTFERICFQSLSDFSSRSHTVYKRVACSDVFTTPQDEDRCSGDSFSRNFCWAQLWTR